MSTAGTRSLASTGVRRTRSALLAGATIALVATRGVSAAEPPVTVEYQSTFAGYRHFDAQASALEWRPANDAIRDGAEGGAHGMRDMRSTMEASPVAGDQPTPATTDEHRAHPQ
jgi:hypothetical protein